MVCSDVVVRGRIELPTFRFSGTEHPAGPKLQRSDPWGESSPRDDCPYPLSRLIVQLAQLPQIGGEVTCCEKGFGVVFA